MAAFLGRRYKGILGTGSALGQEGVTLPSAAASGPVNTVAPVISGTAERGETLTSTTGTWTGTGIITYTYQWKRNGSDISGATSSTYVLVAADDNANITCLVTATDVGGSSSQLSNTLGPVLGSPYLLSAPVASGTAQVGQTLSTTNGSWQGIATITFTYQWRRDTVDITGATASTYVLVADDYATDVDCVVTATNGLGSASADSNDIANIAGIAPIISGVPTISSETQVGQTITATPASATGTPTPTTSWQWQRSSDGVTGWANISGATASTYTLVAADDTKYVRAVQTETNAVGSDSANSAASSQIVSGVAPVISGVPTISSENEVGETITATPASVTGTPTPTTTWQWQRSSDGVTGWADISGATSSTYTLVVADATKYVRVVQTETNALGSDSANSVASSQVVSYTFGNALLVDGTNDYATPSSPITTSATEFVISLWFRSTATGGGAATGFIATQSTESDGLVMANLDRVRIKLDGTSYDYSYSWSNDSDWHHYYWYRDSSGALYLCIDGGSANLLSSGASGGITFDYLFRRGTSNTVNLNGTIDDFYIAETTGSAANAASVYNSGNGANPQTVHSNNGVAFYQFNESSGLTAADSSGNGNDLTLTNFSGTYFVPHTPTYTPVLDSMTATPQFAWSVYQLSSSVTNCFECRRSSDNAETTIGFDSNGLLNTAAVSSHIGGGSGFAVDFYGAASSRNSSEATAANQMTYRASGVLGKPCFVVTNAQDARYPLSTAITGTSEITMFILFVTKDARVNGSSMSWLTDGTNTRGVLRELSDATKTNIGIYNGLGNDGQSVGSFLTDETTYLIEVRRDASNNTQYFINNSSIATSSFTNVPNIQDMAGLNANAELELYELTYFNTDISAADKAAYIAHINNEYGLSLPTYDADAQAYITAAGITDTTEQAAVNQLVLDLKGTGSTPSSTDLWTDAAAFYPISPTSLSAAAYNLRDTTTFNMTWANSPTHASTGVTFDGLTQYGDTGFNPSTASLANGYDLTLGVEIVNANITAVGLMAGTKGSNTRTQMLFVNGNLYQDIHNNSAGRWVTRRGWNISRTYDC